MVPDRAKDQAWAVEWGWEEVLAWEPAGNAVAQSAATKALIPKGAPAIP